MIARTLIGTILLLAMAGAQATMYKWKDAQGNTQFGEFPPAGVEAEMMKPPPPPATTGPAEPSLQDRVKALDEKQSMEKEKARVEQLEQDRADRIKKNCENARQTVQVLGRGGNHLYGMPDGSYQRFNAEERQQRIDESKKYIAENCN